MSILPNKFFKVTLPLATAGTAIIVTAYLISSITKELNKKKEGDPALDNIELKVEKFEEQLIQGPKESEKESKQASDSSENKDSEDLKKEEKEDLKKPEELDNKEPDLEQVKNMLQNAEQVAIEMVQKSKGTKEVDEMKVVVDNKFNPESTAKAASEDPDKSKPEVEGEDQDQNDQITSSSPEKQIPEQPARDADGDLGDQEQLAKEDDSMQKNGLPRSNQETETREAEELTQALDEGQPEQEEELEDIEEAHTEAGSKPPASEHEKEVRTDSEIGEEDEGSEEPLENKGVMQSKDEEGGGEEDIESSSSDEGRGDSEGSDEKGDASVENLKLYEDLQKKLLGGISSMKRFF